MQLAKMRFILIYTNSFGRPLQTVSSNARMGVPAENFAGGDIHLWSTIWWKMHDLRSVLLKTWQTDRQTSP